MFSEASSTIPDNSLTRQGLFGNTLSNESPRILGELALGPVAARSNTSSLEWSSIVTNVTEKSHSAVGNDGPLSQHLGIPDEQEPQNSTEAPAKDTHAPQGSPKKLAKISRESLVAAHTATPVIDTRSSSGTMGPPVTPPIATRTSPLKFPAGITSHSNISADDTALGAQSVSKGTGKSRKSRPMVSPVQASSRPEKRVKGAVDNTGRETEILIETAAVLTAVVPMQKKLRQGRSVSLQDPRSRSAAEPCPLLPSLTGKGDMKHRVNTDPISKDGNVVQLKEKPQHRPSRSRSMLIPASSSTRKESASKQKLSLPQTIDGISDAAAFDMKDIKDMAKGKCAETTDFNEVGSVSSESSKVDPLTVLHSNNVCVEIPVIEPKEEAETPNEEKEEQKPRLQNLTNPSLDQDQFSTSLNEDKASIHVHEAKDVQIELPKKKGRGRPKKSTVIPAVPLDVEDDTNFESEVKAKTKISQHVSYQVLQEIDANSLLDTTEESLLDGKNSEAPSVEKMTPNPQTPQKVQNLKSSTGIPSFSNGKVKHRVGLSRTARCPPLLKMVKK
jgi:hypothetical protein